jgi:RNA polymerase sigma factor (sigma-70 family)
MTTATIENTPTGVPGGTAELLLGVCDGDPAAWKEIVCRYGKLVSTTVRSFRLQEADALDAVQTTWLRLAENAHQVEFPEKLGGWLVTTARRECLHILRQAKSSADFTTMAPETVADPLVDPEQWVIETDTANRLWNLVAKLSPRRKTLLQVLFTDNAPSYDEIAHTTGIPRGAMGPTRARALRQLRNKLNEHTLEPKP